MSEPDNYRVHYYLGTAYTELNENDKAIAEFNKIPESSDHYVESRLQLAYLYDKAKKYDDAIAALNEALKQKPNDTEIMGFLVGIYQRKKGPSDRDRADSQDDRDRSQERQIPLHARRAFRRNQAEAGRRRAK